MATSSIVKLTGVEATTRALRGLAPRLRKQALRTALRAAGRVVRDAVRRRVPLLKASTYSGASALRRGVRKVGTLRRAVAVRTSKLARRQGDVGVFVNIKPLKGGSAKNPNDPYYWRWQEFGWNPASGPRAGSKKSRRFVGKAGGAKSKPGVGFMRTGAAALPQALQAFERSLAPAVVRYQAKGGRP